MTRPAGQADRTVAALEEAGAAVALVPLIRIEPPDDPAPLRRAAAALRAGIFHWGVVTSPNGAEALADALGQAGGGELRARLCAVGPATRAVLERRGLPVHCVPERAEGAAIPDALERVEPLAGRRVLLALGDRADEGLQRALAARGAEVARVTAYRTVEDAAAARRAAALVAQGLVDLVLVASPSQVQALAGAMRGLGAAAPGPVRVVAIGPTTARAAAEAGWQVQTAASTQPRALAEACAEAWRGGQKTEG